MLDNISVSLVKRFIKLFEKDDRYYLADQAIIRLFEKFPENKRLEDILLKISVINDLYSTNIFGTYLLSVHVKRVNIDSALQRGDASIVNKIAVGHGIGKPKGAGDRNFYSFATKYCNWHNQNAFPVYDKYVHRLIMAYQRRDEFSEFDEKDLRNYVVYKQVICDFRTNYSLTQFTLKEIDKFLWMYGKKVFKK